MLEYFKKTNKLVKRHTGAEIFKSVDYMEIIARSLMSYVEPNKPTGFITSDDFRLLVLNDALSIEKDECINKSNEINESHLKDIQIKWNRLSPSKLVRLFDLKYDYSVRRLNNFNKVVNTMLVEEGIVDNISTYLPLINSDEDYINLVLNLLSDNIDSFDNELTEDELWSFNTHTWYHYDMDEVTVDNLKVNRVARVNTPHSLDTFISLGGIGINEAVVSLYKEKGMVINDRIFYLNREYNNYLKQIGLKPKLLDRLINWVRG